MQADEILEAGQNQLAELTTRLEQFTKNARKDSDPAVQRASDRAKAIRTALATQREQRRIEIARELGDPERYSTPLANDLASSAKKQAGGTAPTETPKQLPPAWRGTILPETGADIWLAAAFADYEAIVARELAIRAKTVGRTLTRADQEQVDVALFAPHTHYQAAVRRLGKDVPLREIRSENESDEWYFIAAGKGTLLLAELRARLGDHKFLELMDEFGRAHAGRKVTTQQFRQAVAALKGHSLETEFFDQWLDHEGLPSSRFSAAWSIESFLKEPENALIVYGTVKEKHAQREAADLLQLQIARIWSNVRVAIRPDSEVTAEELKSHHLLIIGRPDTNSIAARVVGKSSPVKFGPASFAVSGDTFAHPASAVIAASDNPLSARYQVVIFAGLSAQSTRSCVQRFSAGTPAEVLVLASGSHPRRMVASPSAPLNHAAR